MTRAGQTDFTKAKNGLPGSSELRGRFLGARGEPDPCRGRRETGHISIRRKDQRGPYLARSRSKGQRRVVFEESGGGGGGRVFES